MIRRYITLEELMREFRAQLFVDLANALGILKMIEFRARGDLPSPQWVLSRAAEMSSALCDVRDECATCGLTLSFMTAERMIALASRKTSDFDEMARLGSELQERLRDEMTSRVFFAIDPAKARLLQDQEPLGNNVARAFPACASDIEEASKCFAFERYTACVYHLMRVVEASVVIIVRRIGYKSPKPGFGEALKVLDDGLKKTRDNYEEASPLFKGDIEFLSGVSAQMHAVNQAWRQRVAHIERTYNEEEALRIWEATKGLMQHLASKLTEAPNG